MFKLTYQQNPFFVFVILWFLTAETVQAKYSAEEIQAESESVNAFFEKSFQGQLDRFPMFQSNLGIKKDYDKWNDISDEFQTRELAIVASELATLRSDFDYEKMDDQTRFSYRLFEYNAEHHIEWYPWRFHDYPVNQMGGFHTFPTFLINTHQITSLKDAQDYISRLRGIYPVFEQLIKNLETRKQLDIIPPKFVFPLVVDECSNIISGQPYDESEELSPLLADFTSKVNNLEEIVQSDKENLLMGARAALLQSVKPAYEMLIVYLTELEKEATTNDGVWKFPNGENYYNLELKWHTTTNLTASQIHQIGLDEVERIQDEIRSIMRELNFKDDLQAFFNFMRTDPQFFYPNTKEGKQAYLDKAVDIIETMKSRLDELFISKPKADIIVKRVDVYLEKSAAKAYYQGPAPDGSRPGRYLINLYNMEDLPIYQMEPLAYHEGIPGHHMQISIARELEDIPRFRRFAGYTVFAEGWALYTESLPKEIGFYKDPYSNFGRLAMEIWRAVRLVVDTGLHHKRWTRQEAIDYFYENTPLTKADCTTEINRYIIWPGQATAYKIGMNKILELRTRAMDELGDKFDLRKYHEVVLANGATPLNILEELINAWIEEYN